MARSITDPDRQAQALAAVAGALAEAGQHEQAETVARSITDPDGQAQALAAVAGALAEAGQHEQAATVARSITNPDGRRGRWRRWPGRWPRPASTSRPPR